MKLNNTLKTLALVGGVAIGGIAYHNSKTGVEEKTKQELIDKSLAEEQALLNEKLAKERKDAEEEKRKNQEIERNNINIDRNASMDEVLSPPAIALVNALLENQVYVNLTYSTEDGKKFSGPASLFQIRNRKDIPNTDFILINNSEDKNLGRAMYATMTDPTPKVILNLATIKSSAEERGKEIGIELPRIELLKMTFREESSHLIGNKGERENDVSLITTLPEKFGMYKIGHMLRNMEKVRLDRVKVTPGYEKAFRKYEDLMNSVGCQSIKDLNLTKLYEMVQKVKTGKFS